MKTKSLPSIHGCIVQAALLARRLRPGGPLRRAETATVRCRAG